MSDQIQLLKELYNQVEDKKEFRLKVAQHFKMSVSTVRTGWFGSRFEVPERYGVRDRLVDFTSAYIDNQNKVEPVTNEK